MIYEDNTIRDVVGFELGRPLYGPARYDPILPGMCDRKHSFKNCVLIKLKKLLICRVSKYEIHADNAPTRLKEIKWEKVTIEQQSKEEYIDNVPHFAPNI